MRQFYFVPNKIIEKGKLYIYFYIMTYYKPYSEGFIRTGYSEYGSDMMISLHYDLDSYCFKSADTKRRYKEDYIEFVKDVYGVNYNKQKGYCLVKKETLKKYDIGMKTKRYAVIFCDEFKKIMNVSTRYRLNSLYFLCIYRLNMKRRSWKSDKIDRYANYYKCFYNYFYGDYGFSYKSVKSIINILEDIDIIYAVREGKNIEVFNETKNKSYNRQYLYITDYKDDGSHIDEIKKAVRLEEENSEEENNKE